MINLLQLCSVIVFGCISAKGWYKDGPKEKCLYNNDNNACRLGSGLGLIGLLASIAFLIIEALFQNLSSIKIRRRVVVFDLGFSGNIYYWLNYWIYCKQFCRLITVIINILQDFGPLFMSYVLHISEFHGENRIIHHLAKGSIVAELRSLSHSFRSDRGLVSLLLFCWKSYNLLMNRMIWLNVW